MEEFELQGTSKPKPLYLESSKTFDVEKQDSFLNFKKKKLANIFYILRRLQKT